MSGPPAIRLHDAAKSFNGRAAVAPLSLDVVPGAFVALLGPSGCGKSTLLRVIADLETPTSGSVDIAPGTSTAFVFQDAHLLPWRNVIANVALPLELAGTQSQERTARAADALRRVGLAGTESLYPAQLSGGMKMRVSLARALVGRPNLLLLDEPFAALDEITRQQLDDLLRTLWRQTNLTVLFVTHSIGEAAYLADRVIVFSRRPARVMLDRASALPADRSPALRTTTAFAAEARRLFEALVAGERGVTPRRLLVAVWPPLAVLVLVLGGTELAVRFGLVAAFLVPRPTDAAIALDANAGEIAAALRDTAVAALAGFALAALVGVGLAVLLASGGLVRRALYPYAVFFQTVPIIAIAPLLVIWFGFGIRAVIASAFVASVFPVIANTLAGLLSVDRPLEDLFRLYRAKPLAALVKLRLPFALPQIFTGLRVAAGLSVIGAIVGEFITGGGLGGLIQVARQQRKIDKVFATLFVASLLGVTMFASINLLARLALRHWHASERQSER